MEQSLASPTSRAGSESHPGVMAEPLSRDMRVSSRRSSPSCDAASVLACTSFIEGDDGCPGCPPNDTPLSQSAETVHHSHTRRSHRWCVTDRHDRSQDSGSQCKACKSAKRRQLREQLSPLHETEGAPSTVRIRRRSVWENASGFETRLLICKRPNVVQPRQRQLKSKVRSEFSVKNTAPCSEQPANRTQVAGP